MINSIKDRALLNNGQKMPWLGFGVHQVKDGQIESGPAEVRHILHICIGTEEYAPQEFIFPL